MRTNRELVKRRRLEKGLTLKEVAEQVNQSISMVSYVESGRYQISIPALPLYAKALDLPEQALVIFEN